MKPTIIFLAHFSILRVVFAAQDASCCKFTLSSQGAFDYPAGQLADGQIRLNGTYKTSTFCIDSEGGMTDENGFGCIVTESPTTQIQCDEGKPPTKGFSIQPGGALHYKGSAAFSACPATDTEYNIYVSPDFGQKKCLPISLQANDGGRCSAPTTTACSTTTSTVLVTRWATPVADHVITWTTTVTPPCTTSAAKTPACNGSAGVSGGCHKPPAAETGIWNGTASSVTSGRPAVRRGVHWFAW